MPKGGVRNPGIISNDQISAILQDVDHRVEAVCTGRLTGNDRIFLAAFWSSTPETAATHEVERSTQAVVPS